MGHYKPLNDGLWNYYDELSFVPSQYWHYLLSDFTTTKGSDNEEPIIHSETDCTKDNQYGYCLDISDNIAIKSVDSIGLMPYGDDYILLYSEKLAKKQDEYFLPKFNDEWYYICDGSFGNQCIPPSAIEVESSDNYKLYTTVGQYNATDVVFFIQIEKNTGIKFWAIPTSNEEQGTKIQYSIKKGDTIRFDFFVYSTLDGSMRIEEGNTLTLTNNPIWVKKDFNVLVEYFASADDFNNNSVTSSTFSTQGQQPSLNTPDEKLAYLNGKTLTFSYTYGDNYTDDYSFNTAVRYDTNLGLYFIRGSNAIDCTALNNFTVNNVTFSYQCIAIDSFNSQELYIFNINDNGSLTGYYEYAKEGQNALNEISNPDSVLNSSYIY